MIKILNFFLLSVLFQFFVSVSPVFAETVNFDDRSSDKACFTATLNETIAVKVNGQTGAGCEFSVDVEAGGEWVNTGGYFGSPPYAWGKDSFHSLQGIDKDEYSFTCSQPAYQLDESDLPSYVTVTKEEDVPASGTKPKMKRYFFSVGAAAESGKSFNAPFKFSTDCAMKKNNNGDGEIRPMTPIGRRESGERCAQVDDIDINPREKESKFPITIGAACAPTATPTPPPPTATPTSTPVPTATPTPTPTPTPPGCNMACSADRDCEGAKDGCTACVSGSCRIPPACNVSCTTPADCQGAKDGCTACVPSDTGGGSVCKPPPACGVSCTKDDQCAGARDGCTACVGGTCKIPPACGVACTRTADCAGARDGCTTCVANKCEKNPFTEAMCKCDGIEVSTTQFVPGEDVTFTAYGKVEGSDTTWASIQDIKFRVIENDTKLLKDSGFLPAEIAETTSTGVRYRVQWTYTIPAVSQGSKIKIQATTQCAQKEIAGLRSPMQSKTVAMSNQAVLAETTSNSRLCNIPLIGAIVGLFGMCGTSSSATPANTAVPTVTPTSQPDSNLHLQTFGVGSVSQKVCNSITVTF